MHRRAERRGPSARKFRKSRGKSRRENFAIMRGGWRL